MKYLLLVFFAVSVFLFSCTKRYSRLNNVYSIPGVNNNVCKKLRGKVLLYAIFVDTRQNKPWTSYDISSTLDSIRKATSWLMNQARENNIPLSIQLKYHVKDGVIPIEQHLYGETLSGMLFGADGVETTDRWANTIAKKAGESFEPDTSTKVRTKNIIINRERLIARLRDQYQTDNVAVMYFLNNYYTDEVSVAVYTASQNLTEFCIVTFKHPAVIAHEFLHAFGALDLYQSPFQRKRKGVKNRVAILRAYPNEVMAIAYRPLEKLSISPMSQYFIGWRDSLSESDRKLLVGKKIKLYNY